MRLPERKLYRKKFNTVIYRVDIVDRF